MRNTLIDLRPDVGHSMQFDDLDQAGLIRLAKPFGALIDRVGKIGGVWVAPDVVRAYQAQGISLIANNFYGVVPDLAALPETLWQRPAFQDAWAQVSCDDDNVVLSETLAFLPELRDYPREADLEFGWNNGMFPPLDAVVYYGLVRSRQPRQIIEIGAGYSTLIALRACAENGVGSITCIEPYPSAALTAREADLTKLIRQPVQNIPDELFLCLDSGDILFIDTSHASKAGSDVHDILFRVLPLLKTGVIIHIHDIFLPFEYPREWISDIGIIWNEQYAVLALLMNSSRYRVIMPNHLASIEHADALELSFAALDVADLTRNMSGARGASLWLTVSG